MSFKKVMLLLVLHWGVSASCGIIRFVLIVLNGLGSSWKFMLILNMALDIAILISFITTYIYFYITVRRLRGLEARGSDQPSESGLDLLIKKFKLPCYIVVTYICFNITSTSMFTAGNYVHNAEHVNALKRFGHIPIIVGLISDAFIYVFANRNVRNLFCSFFIARNLWVRSSDIAA